MPLPRFNRLPADRRAHILKVAREHFAAHGPDGASYNKIIAASGISKTAAYQYFDGKDDLLATVLDDVLARLLEALRPWRDVGTEEEFWQRLREGSARLVSHLTEHLDDHMLADLALGAHEGDYVTAWLAAVLANGRAIGVIRDDIDDSLLLTVTAAVFKAADAWQIEAMRAGKDGQDQLWQLLAGLWGSRAGERDG